eukprot:TRINITY_DN76854_c0_g1_i4.p1 TRINITY_DN76854_c0_g1~~TRINITY_DN76854_c0_g1_i4.p1  ORF type:complete len:128 (+),score=16.57 TRINITY_DN76854_c0_g1_i4:98-481(+)
MKFKIESPIVGRSVIKATVHKDGKLGFSSAAANYIGLDKNRHFKVATNGEDPLDENIYLIPSNKEDEQAFKANKAGKYYYLRIKHILDKYKVNYKEERTIYDIVEGKEEEMIFYTLKKKKADQVKVH